MNIWKRLFGVPIWTQDFDGEVRKSRLRITKCGMYLIKVFGGWFRANPDGTTSKSFVDKWWHR